MRLRRGLGRKRIYGVFRVHGTSLVAASVVLPAGRGANSAPPNPLARFEGVLQGGERERTERKERDARDGSKHSRNKFLVMALSTAATPLRCGRDNNDDTGKSTSCAGDRT